MSSHQHLRIAMVFGFDPSVHGGLADRLLERLNTWTDLGQPVHVFACARPDSRLTTLAIPELAELTVVIGKNSLHASRSLHRALRSFSPHVIYLRSDPFPSAIRIARSWPTVIEIHGDPSDENSHVPRLNRLVGVAHPLLVRASRGAVLIDPSLAERPFLEPLKGPIRVITNGIDTRRPPRSYQRSPGDTTRVILAAGSDYPWQGIPKYLALARLLPEVEFNIAGSIEPQKYAAPPNVTFLGPVPSTQLPGLLQSMDAGFGNLSLEVVGRRTPSPLKVREYIANDLPAIIAHDDPDLAGAPGVLNLGFGFQPSEAHAQRILKFLREWSGRTLPDKTRHTISAAPKEKDRINFLRTVACGSAS